MSEAREIVVVVGRKRAWSDAEASRCGAFSVPSNSSAPTIHCSSCGHGFCPRDEHLGIENTSLSPALTRMVGTVGAMVSFQEGSELLTELAGVAVDAKPVERTAEALGKQIAEDERHCIEPCDALPLSQTLYLGMDGTGIPLRAEKLVGRTGKQADGSAKTGEVKLCTIWSA
jgi:hypothetical protein